jgi:hypothetical protein
MQRDAGCLKATTGHPLMTTASLREKPVRDLARLAKQHGVTGWHAMRKDQLIRALVKKAKSKTVAPAATLRPSVTTTTKGKPKAATKADRLSPTSRKVGSTAAKLGRVESKKPTSREAAIARRIKDARDRLARAKNLASAPEQGKPGRVRRDRLVLMVRGPHWIHAFWEVTPRSMARAEAALGQEWHAAQPVLRVLEIESGSQASASERVVREIEIHGGLKNWFIDIRDRITCRAEVGYRTPSGRFHSLARSNMVSTPSPSQGDTLDAHWGEIVENCDKIYSMSGGFSPENNSTELQELFEERLRRPLGPPAARRAGSTGADAEEGLPRRSDFLLEVDAQVVVFGVTKPGSYVTLQGEPVKVQEDGTFRVRLDMPDKRQVLPIVASTSDGVEEQTVVLAVERNTKVMEPYNRDSGDL